MIPPYIFSRPDNSFRTNPNISGSQEFLQYRLLPQNMKSPMNRIQRLITLQTITTLSILTIHLIQKCPDSGYMKLSPLLPVIKAAHLSKVHSIAMREHNGELGICTTRSNKHASDLVVPTGTSIENFHVTKLVFTYKSSS